LQGLYPHAETRVFTGTGHATALTVPDEFASVVIAFLDRYTSLHERTGDHVARA
jgi:pimeloyl-ACP methyl ester carboxylesterase